MKKAVSFIIVLLTFSTLLKGQAETGWTNQPRKKYSIFFTVKDAPQIAEYRSDIDKGIQAVEDFFLAPYPKPFRVYIYVNRSQLDSAWSVDWKSPGFKSECWMVASGVAARIDILSPMSWDKQACEHVYSDKNKTRQVIAHELFHVYHGQFNASPDFSETENIDWFVEGLASYASGQCDQERLDSVRKAIATKTVPVSLDKFWTGNIKYGLSGSMVMYIDSHYGRAKLKEILVFNKKDQLLKALGTDENALMKGWLAFMQTNGK